MKTLINLLKDDSGASAAEYALILAIVGSGIALAAVFLGDAITTAFSYAATSSDNRPSGRGSNTPPAGFE